MLKIKFVLLFVVLCCIHLVTAQSKKQPNILFIGIDDLRPELGCYGSEIAVTPNLDKLASEGLLFERAYCQQAICGPSRASILTGIRPETSGVYHNYIKFREANPQVVTLPQLFAHNGYEALYCGKIFHHGDRDDKLSWNRQPALDSMEAKGIMKPLGFNTIKNQNIKESYRKEMFAKYGQVAKFGLASGSAYESADVPDNAYADGYNTELAIASMREILKEGNKPFFLGLGFHKPHLNWTSPKKYWDLYDREKIPLTKDEHGALNGAEMGLHPSFELRVRHGIPKEGKIDEELAKTLKHAYLACVSYVDAQIGKMLEALDASGERENTIVIVWSDHGWHLGDKGIWGKATNYEIATRVPLIISAPQIKDKHKGKKTDALVELVDMYPTLCEMAELPVPKTLEGKSFVPLLNHPQKKWKKAAFSQFPTPALREWGAYPLRPAMRETYFGPLIEEVEQRIKKQQKDNWDRELFENKLMGYAMRTDRYRLIVWENIEDKKAPPIWIELYDHKTDPQETINIAQENPKRLKKLMNQYKKGW